MLAGTKPFSRWMTRAGTTPPGRRCRGRRLPTATAVAGASTINEGVTMVTDYDERDAMALPARQEHLPIYPGRHVLAHATVTSPVASPRYRLRGWTLHPPAARAGGAGGRTGYLREMIRLAREQGPPTRGIEYVVGDAARRPIPPQGLPTSPWPPSCWCTREPAKNSPPCAARWPVGCVTAGGSSPSPSIPMSTTSIRLPDYRRYGIGMRLADHAYDGAPINFSVLLPDATLEIENYYPPIETYLEELQSAGFADVRTYGLSLPPALRPTTSRGSGTSFWRTRCS